MIVMKALSQDFRRGCLWELLHADDLVIMDESLDGLLNHFTTWKDSFDAKGLGVNMSKTKILVSTYCAPLLFKKGVFDRISIFRRGYLGKKG